MLTTCPDTDFPCSQVKCSVPQGHCSLCWGGKGSCGTPGRNGDVGADKTCARTAAEFQQPHQQPALAISLWLRQPRSGAGHGGTRRAGTRQTPAPGHARALPEQCQALLGDQLCVPGTDCEGRHDLNMTCMAALLLLLFWPLLTMCP